MLRGVIDRFVGRGDAAITVPPMDGALRPNQRLEEAHVVMEARAPDNLVLHHGEVLFSSGRDLRKLETGAALIGQSRASRPLSTDVSRSA